MWKILNLQTNSHSLLLRDARASTQRILFSPPTQFNWETTGIRDPSRQTNKTDTATNGFPFATTRCDKLNSSKVPIQILKHFATPKSRTFAPFVRLNPLCSPIQKRKQQQHNQFKYFFNAKTYAQTRRQHNCTRINSFTASRIVRATHTLVHLAPAA